MLLGYYQENQTGNEPYSGVISMIKVDTKAIKAIMIYLSEHFEKDSLVSYLKVIPNAIKVTDTTGDTAVFKYNDGVITCT